jgi:hypothetical protein
MDFVIERLKMTELHRAGNEITVTSPANPQGTVSFSVRDKPVLLNGDFCDWQDAYHVMRITGVCGIVINTLPYSVDGNPIVLNQQSPSVRLSEPGRYMLVSFDGGSRTATITRQELGIQFLQGCCS